MKENKLELGELAFTAEEIRAWQKKNQFAELPSENELDYGNAIAQFAADGLNSLLTAKLARAPQIFWPDDRSMERDFRDMGAQKPRDTHTARLVCIEEIEK